MQILIVEDEENIANLLRKEMLEERYTMDIARDGEYALFKFEINEYDLIILDLMIPKVSGQDVCRTIRHSNTSISILILTAKDAVEDKVAGLYAGADDYVIKPFPFSELPARVRARIRRNKIAVVSIPKKGSILSVILPINK